MDVPSLLSKAATLAKEGRADEALACCDQALAIKTAKFPGLVWAMKAVILRDTKQYWIALGCFEKAQELGEDVAGEIEFCQKALGMEVVPKPVPYEEVLLNTARTLREEGLPDAALVACDKVLSSGNSKYATEAWKSKATTYRTANKDSKALDCLEQAAKLGDKFAMKAAEMLRKEIQDAGSKGKPALAEDGDALFYKGESLMNQGKPAEALACFEEALKINPNSAYTWYSRGVALGQLERSQDEIASYDRALKLNPSFPEAWYNKAITLGNSRHYQEALASFEKARELNYPDAEQGISFCKQQLQKEAEGSTAESDGWLKKGSDLVAIGGDPQEALECFEKSLAINPNSERAWWGKGISLGNLGRLDEGLAAYDKAFALNPGKTGSLISKARALYAAHRVEEALQCFQRARELGDQEGLRGYIMCWQELHGNQNP